ncbi:hypothetical protein GC722_04685 [Auraticoccus sp. F435]|uniref:Protein kinase domain-containing protein n=1 Tax=Auraticoccus cholistanensis TaxID=2656650 RepID=A0A6A9UVU1_9ACTN|nr:hypothetical protein [Auraticoccus cholistanensis]MVA75327.1 hypothetical protein [Auraticoccus cholistanensis]
MQPATPAGRRVGTRLGSSRLTDLLHETSARAIYRAEEPGGSVALVMVLSEQVAAHPVVRSRFSSWMARGAGVLERHLVPLRRWGEVDGLLCAELGVLSGTGLATLLEHQPLPPARALALLEDLAAAVDAAHSRGVAHLALSPTTVVVGHDEVARVTDLGLGALLAEAGVAPDAPELAYRAPWLTGPVDPAGPAATAADLWSLAALLHDALTGVGPAAAPAAVPAALVQLLRQRLGPRPAGSQTAAELARAARAAMAAGGPPVPLPPRSEPDPEATALRSALHGPGPARPAVPVRTPPGTTTPATSASGVTRPLTAPTPPAGPPAPPQQHPAPPQQPPVPPQQRQQPPSTIRAAPRRRSLVPVVALLLALLAVVATGVFLWLLFDPPGRPGGTAGTAAPRTTQQPSPQGTDGEEPRSPSATPRATPALPAGAVVCEPAGGPAGGLRGSAAGTPRTSCPFAEETRQQLARTPDPFAAQQVEATSPVTRQTYTLSCDSADGLITCTGGDDAVVLVW